MSACPAAGGESDEEDIGANGVRALVQGRGGADEVLLVLDDIADAVEESKRSEQPNTSRTSRKHENINEFQALVKRVMSGDAEVVLRKVFLYQGRCSVMQEIWIQDKKNPDARVKTYTI